MSNSSDLCTDLNLDSTFARCLINTLLNLSSSALEALQKLLQTEVVFIDFALTDLITQAIAADVLGQQATLAKNFAEAEIQQIEQLLNGLPLGTLDQSCLDWANLNGGINGFIQNEIVPPIEQILFELDRIISFQSQINALKTEYEALKQFFSDVISLLDSVILEAKCREANVAR